MRKTITAALAVAAVASAALPACGGSDEDQIRDAVGRLGKAFADSNGEAACDLMTGAAKRELVATVASLAGGGCEGTVRTAASLLDDAERRRMRDAKVTSVTITGDTAVAATNADGSDGPAELRKVDGHWLFDAGSEDY